MSTSLATTKPAAKAKTDAGQLADLPKREDQELRSGVWPTRPSSLNRFPPITTQTGGALAALVERFNAAWEAHEWACGYDDFLEPQDSRFDAAAAVFEETEKETEAAFDAILSFVPRTLAELADKAVVLANGRTQAHMIDPAGVIWTLGDDATHLHSMPCVTEQASACGDGAPPSLEGDLLRDATAADYLAVEWEAWTKENAARLPRGDEWSAVWDPHGMTLHFAHAVMERTKPELADTARSLGVLNDDGGDFFVLAQRVIAASELFGGWAAMLDAAEARMLAAAHTVAAEAGVDVSDDPQATSAVAA